MGPQMRRMVDIGNKPVGNAYETCARWTEMTRCDPKCGKVETPVAGLEVPQFLRHGNRRAPENKG